LEFVPTSGILISLCAPGVDIWKMNAFAEALLDIPKLPLPDTRERKVDAPGASSRNDPPALGAEIVD
jgi:hypothetical protein